MDTGSKQSKKPLGPCHNVIKCCGIVVVLCCGLLSSLSLLGLLSFIFAKRYAILLNSLSLCAMRSALGVFREGRETVFHLIWEIVQEKRENSFRFEMALKLIRFKNINKNDRLFLI